MEKFLTVDGIAEILGMHPDTVRDYFRESRFPGAFRIGMSWRLSESDLSRWTESKKDPEIFIERELKVLRETPEYENEADPVTRGIMEMNIRDTWDRAQYGKKKTPIPAEMIFTGQHDETKKRR